MSREGILWIGGLEPYMSEQFIRNALSLMGEDDALTKVKLIRNKYTGERASYGFLQFESDAAALMTMHKLNSKIIPNSAPPVKFQLNHASAKASGGAYSVREYSIWVSDLPPNISEHDFRKTFSTRYESIRSCKLIQGDKGKDGKDKKRYGFVRFTDMNDQREALIHMNGFDGLGAPIKVSMAIPKPCLTEAQVLAEKQGHKFQHMYEDYSNDRGAWGNAAALGGPTVFTSNGPQSLSDARTGQPMGVSGGEPTLRLVSGSAKGLYGAAILDWDLLMMSDDDSEDDDEEKEMAGNRLIEHDIPVNVDALNAEFVERSQAVWDAVEKDRWIYNLENDEGMAPNFRKQAMTSKQKLAKVLTKTKKAKLLEGVTPEGGESDSSGSDSSSDSDDSDENDEDKQEDN